MENFRVKKRIPHCNQKMKSFNCMLTLISVMAGTVDLSQRGISLEWVLHQSNALWYGTSGWEQIMPQFFVVFSVLDRNSGFSGSQSSLKLTHRVVHKPFGSLQTGRLPPLFAIQIFSQHNRSCPERYFYCWYCADARESTEFRCHDSSECPETMMRTYLSKLALCRRHIPWTYFKKGEELLPVAIKKFCPLT